MFIPLVVVWLGTRLYSLPGVPLGQFGDYLFQGKETLIDGDSFLGSLPGGPSGIESLRARQVHQVLQERGGEEGQVFWFIMLK